MKGRSAGWYADPVTVGAARYWDGLAWTHRVAWGGTIVDDRTPLGDVERLEAIARAEIVSDYLTGAVDRQVVTPVVADTLRADVERRVPSLPTPATTGMPTKAAPAKIERSPTTPPAERARPAPAAARASMPASMPPPATPPVPGPDRAGTTARLPSPPTATEGDRAIPAEPGRLARWWSDARTAIRTDIALHGLAYLGVLLLFAGVTGLITFSFGDVAPWVRALSELMVPTALFVSAWYLQRRGASVVGASLALLGGAISPIVVTASFTDGAPFPPDLSGRSLPIVQGAAVGLVAIGMGLVARRSPSSPLRFLAGPTLWLAAGLIAAVGRNPIPAGYETARPESFQLAVILAAVTATVLVCPWQRIPKPLADATRLVALPAAGVVYVLEIALAGDEGWPLAGTIVIGLAALFLLELVNERSAPTVTSVLQFVVAAVTALRLAAVANPEWVAMGAAIALLALVEYVGWRRPAQAVTWVGLGLSGSAFVLTFDNSPATAIGFGLLTVWGLWRHVRPAEWLPITDDHGIVAAAAAVTTTIALWDLTERGPAVVTTAGMVLAIAIAGRLWRPIADDALWVWFVPCSAASLAAVSMGLPWAEFSTEVAIASALAAVALVLSTLPSWAKAWVTSAVIVWSLANVAEAVGLDPDAQAVSLAAAALALVVGSLIVAKPICVHLAAIGQVTGLAALAAPTWPGWAATSVVAAASAGWWATAFVDERGQAIHLAALRAALPSEPDTPQPDTLESDTLEPDTPRPDTLESDMPEPGRRARPDPLGELAPLASLAGLWATVLLAVDAAGWIAGSDPWMTAISSGVALTGACVARLTPWRRARRPVLAWVTLGGGVATALVAIAAVGSDRGHWAPVVALVLGLAIVGVTAAPRPSGFVWTGWVGCAALTVFVADRAGLDRDWADVALAGWGSVALLGGLAVHRAHDGPLATGSFVRDRLLLPPIVLGTIAFVIGGYLGLATGSETGIGWTAAGMSAVVLAAAMLLPLGALVAPAEVLAIAAYILLAPWEPNDRPWTFLPAVLLLLGAAFLTRRSGEWSQARWDLPSFFVAHGVAVLALLAAIESDTVVATYAGFGAVAVAIAVVLRRWPWAAAGAALVLVAGVDAGHGWLALVLAVEGIALTVAGLLRARIVRSVLVALGAAAIIGAWYDLAAWQSWSMTTVFSSTVPAGAVVALVAAVGLRSARVPKQLAVVWAIAGPLVAGGTAVVGLGEVARLPGGLILAGSLLVLAGAAGISATVTGAAMRWTAAGLAATAWAPAAWALEISSTAATLVGTGVALAGLTALSAVHGRRPNAVWLHPAAFYASVTQLAAAVAAIGALPDRDLVIVVLLALSAELVALAVLSRRAELYVLAPVPACGAWLLFAADALTGEANWFTVPIGLTLLVMVALLRWIRRGRGGDPATYDVIALEFVGMSFLVGSALARTLAGHLWHGVVAIGIGALIAGWGVMTRVRRRAGFGAAVVVLSAVLLIGVPLSTSITWTGPTLWLTLSVIGISAIVVASAIERGRERVGQIVHRVDQMTAGWERIPLGGAPHDDDEAANEPVDDHAPAEVEYPSEPVGNQSPAEVEHPSEPVGN